MFGLYKLDGTRTYRFTRTVTLGGILADYLSNVSDKKQPDPKGRMDWEIDGDDLRNLVLKQFSPQEMEERQKVKLIIDATYGRSDALLLEICHVWGIADPDWSPLLLRLRQVSEWLTRVHGAGTPVESFELSLDAKHTNELIHEFLYLQWGHQKGAGRQKNFGKTGYTNAALLWPEYLEHLLGKIGFKRVS